MFFGGLQKRKSMKKQILSGLLKIINAIIIKRPNSFYFIPSITAKDSCEDYFNHNSSNNLTCLYYMVHRKFSEKIYITVEYTDKKRKELYDSVVAESKKNNINLCFLYKSYDRTNLLKRVFNVLTRYLELFKHKYWIIGTGDHQPYGKLKSQKCINTNYFISCKSDYIHSSPRRWEHIDYFLTCSLLHSTVSAAQTGVLLGNCCELGFPRNDCLFENFHKKEIISWIKEKSGRLPKKIIVYAPTYRDYEVDSSSNERLLFGYDIPYLEQWLIDNDVVIVCKLHNLQAKKILKYPKGVVNFEATYAFAFYELLSITDCLITDYSSVGYDYMLLDRPLIYNLYDYDYYVETRGVSYEPYESFCPGTIVRNANEMFFALENVVNGKDVSQRKRRELLPLFHKNSDNKSAARMVDFLCDLTKIKYFSN